MNTITVQFNDRQFDALQNLIPYAMDHLDHRISIEGDNGYRDDFKAELAMAGEVAEALSNTKSYLWTDTYGRISLDIPAEHIDDIARPGDAEPAVRAAIENDAYLRTQLQLISEVAGKEFLTDAGIEDADKKGAFEIQMYLLWMACNDIKEERNQED